MAHIGRDGLRLLYAPLVFVDERRHGVSPSLRGKGIQEVRSAYCRRESSGRGSISRSNAPPSAPQLKHSVGRAPCWTAPHFSQTQRLAIIRTMSARLTIPTSAFSRRIGTRL